MKSPSDERDAALDLLEATRGEYLEHAREVATRIGQERGSCTVDDVRELAPPPEGIDPRVMGAIFRPREWEPGGWVQSRRRACHGRPVRVFRYRGPG